MKEQKVSFINFLRFVQIYTNVSSSRKKMPRIETKCKFDTILYIRVEKERQKQEEISM